MKPFPFFRLSRELRDQIYAELESESAEINVALPKHTQYAKSVHWDRYMGMQSTFKAEFSPMPVTNFVLVSRAFKDEYETELRRHLCLKIAFLTHRRLQSECLTEENGKLRRLLHGVLELEMRIWRQRWGSYDAEIYNQLRGFLLPLLPNLKSATQDLLFKVPATDLDNCNCPLELQNMAIFEDKPLPLPDQVRTIPLKTRVYLTSALVNINPNYCPTAADIREFSLLTTGYTEPIRKWLKDYPSNDIIFRATPAKKDGGTVWGLDLESEEGEKVYDWRVPMRVQQRDSEAIDWSAIR